LDWNITTTKWWLYALVVYQWTYWSETVNSSNFYRIWARTINTVVNWIGWHNWTIYTAQDNDLFWYISSDLFETSLLSKTDAKYTYKLWTNQPTRISTGAYTSWQVPKYDFKGVSKRLSGLTLDWVYKLSDTPWAVTTGSATNTKNIGRAVVTDWLYLYDTLSPNL
jgi:hypothetical protein